MPAVVYPEQGRRMEILWRKNQVFLKVPEISMP